MGDGMHGALNISSVGGIKAGMRSRARTSHHAFALSGKAPRFERQSASRGAGMAWQSAGGISGIGER